MVKCMTNVKPKRKQSVKAKLVGKKSQRRSQKDDAGRGRGKNKKAYF